MKYEKDDGPLFPKIKEKSQKLLPRVAASPIGRQIMTVGTIQKHGYDKALALLFSLVMVFGGYYFFEHRDTIVRDVRGGFSVLQDEMGVTFIGNLHDAPDGAFLASVHGAWNTIDTVAIQWYRAVCTRIGVCQN